MACQVVSKSAIVSLSQRLCGQRVHVGWPGKCFWEVVVYMTYPRKGQPATRACMPLCSLSNLLPSLVPNGLLSLLPNHLPRLVHSLVLSLHPNLQQVSPFLCHPRSMFNSSRWSIPSKKVVH